MDNAAWEGIYIKLMVRRIITVYITSLPEELQKQTSISSYIYAKI